MEEVSGPKISFGFAKKIEPKVKIPPRASSDSSLFSHHHEETRDKRDGNDEELIIPLIKRNRWQVKASDPIKKNAHGSQSLSSLPEVDKSSVAPEIKQEPLSTIKEPLNEDEVAAQEIMKDIQKFHIGNDEDEPMEIPSWMENRLPAGFETDEKLNVDLRAEESTLDDYERIPVEKYGLAMLRGMGWRPEEGIGKTHKQATKPVEVKVRPRGLGLGAVPAKEKKKQQKEEDEQKPVLPGSKVIVTQGRYENRVGRVIGVDSNADRFLVELRGEEKRVASISAVGLRVISEKEYEKTGKYINLDMYYEHKIVQEEKLDRIRKEVHERENGRRSGSSDRAGKSSGSDDRRPRRTDRDSGRHRDDDRKSDRKKRRSRSRSRDGRR